MTVPATGAEPSATDAVVSDTTKIYVAQGLRAAAYGFATVLLAT